MTIELSDLKGLNFRRGNSSSNRQWVLHSNDADEQRNARELRIARFLMVRSAGRNRVISIVQESVSRAMGKSNANRKLVAAVRKGDINGVSTALEGGVDLTVLVDDIPPLGRAVYENQPEIARPLLEAGSDVDVPQYDGTTPLQTCSSIRNEHLPDKDAVVMETLLIEHGANVMACGDKNHDCAPLAMAIMRGKKKLAALLKSHGARSFNVSITARNE